MSRNPYKSFLRNYYLSTFFYDFVFAYAIYNVLFNIRGLSIFQISLLLSWWALSALLLEIPSGALADRWNRKAMLVLAPLVKSLCFMVWYLAEGNFYIYALGFLFWSVGSSFVSGTSQAVLYDHLVFFNKQNKYEKALGRKKFYFHISVAVSIISGGVIAHFSLDWAVLLSVIPLLLSAFFAIFIKEAPKTEVTGETHYLEYIKIAYLEVKNNKPLKLLFLYSFGISIFLVIEEFDQLYYQLAGLPLMAFGVAGFIWSILNSIGCYFAHRLKRINWICYSLPLFSAGLLILVGFFPGIPMIGLLFLSYFLVSPIVVLIESRIQHSIKSISRATVTSVNSLLINLFGALLTPIFGLISRIWNLQAIYISTALFLIVFSMWVFIRRHTFLELKS